MEVIWKESLPVTDNNLENLLAPSRAMANTAYPTAEILPLFE